MDTPRTDAACFDGVRLKPSGDEHCTCVDANFARTLERELAEAVDAATAYKDSWAMETHRADKFGEYAELASKALLKAANDMDDIATDSTLLSSGRIKAQLRDAAKDARAALSKCGAESGEARQSFAKLREQMSPEAQERAAERTKAMLEGNEICNHEWAPAELSESGDRVMGRSCLKCGIPQDVDRSETPSTFTERDICICEDGSCPACVHSQYNSEKR